MTVEQLRRETERLLNEAGALASLGAPTEKILAAFAAYHRALAAWLTALAERGV